MSASVFQERGVTRYIAHPPSYTAGAPGADGWSLDAGTAMMLASNSAHMIVEGKRQLVQSPGPGTSISVWADKNAPWAGFNEGVIVDPNRIPWDRRSARRFRVITALEDRANSDGEPRQRKIRFVVRADLAATVTVADTFFTFAASSSPNPLLLNPTDAGAMVARASVTAAATGTQTFTADLSTEFLVTIPTRPEPLRCRPGSTRGPAFVRVQPLWLFFGWRIVDATAAASAVLSFSAYEQT